jgi:hypothetical protein
MTEEQFRKFMAVQVAQLAVFQGIYANVATIAASSGKATGYHWGEVESLLKNAEAIAAKLRGIA